MANVGHKLRFQSIVDRFCRVVAKKADLSPGGQVHRALKRFAIAAFAGELATKFGITDWPTGAASAAAREVFLDWFEAQEGTTNQEVATAVERTQKYISTHLDRFQTIGTTDHHPVDGWRDHNWFYIRPDRWRAMHSESGPTEIARLHAEGGLLKTQKGDGYQFKMGRNIPERPRVYAVHASKLLGATGA